MIGLHPTSFCSEAQGYPKFKIVHPELVEGSFCSSEVREKQPFDKLRANGFLIAKSLRRSLFPVKDH